METESDGGEKKHWTKTPTFIGIAAALGISLSAVGVLSYVDSKTNQYKQSIGQQALDDQLAVENQRKIEYAYEFATCWWKSSCDPKQFPTQLPADREQFKRLDEVEAALIRLHQFLKKHCQGHRDRQEVFSDCTEL